MILVVIANLQSNEIEKIVPMVTTQNAFCLLNLFKKRLVFFYVILVLAILFFFYFFWLIDYCSFKVSKESC